MAHYHYSPHQHKQLENPIAHLGLLYDEEYGLYIMAEPFSAVIFYTDDMFYVDTYLFDGYELSSNGYTLDEITAYIKENEHHLVYLISCRGTYSWSIVDSPVENKEGNKE